MSLSMVDLYDLATHIMDVAPLKETVLEMLK